MKRSTVCAVISLALASPALARAQAYTGLFVPATIVNPGAKLSLVGTAITRYYPTLADCNAAKTGNYQASQVIGLYLQGTSVGGANVGGCVPAVLPTKQPLARLYMAVFGPYVQLREYSVEVATMADCNNNISFTSVVGLPAEMGPVIPQPVGSSVIIGSAGLETWTVPDPVDGTDNVVIACEPD